MVFQHGRNTLRGTWRMLMHGKTMFNIGIKHDFSCINIRQVPRDADQGFQYLPRNLANVNAVKYYKVYVRSILLHNIENILKISRYFLI